MRAWPYISLILKWIVVPVALLWVGYYFIGPQIGVVDLGKAKSASDAPPNPAPVSQDSAPDNLGDGDQPKIARHGEPEVQVSVRPATSRYAYRDRFSDSPRRRTRRRRKKSATEGTGGTSAPVDVTGPAQPPSPGGANDGDVG